MRKSKWNLDRITSVTRGWANLRPNKQFSGLTLEKCNEIVKPSLDIRAEQAELESRLRALDARLAAADAVSLATVQSVVHGVKGDLAEGDDGELYEAMGFVRRSQRSSGLTRRRVNPEAKPTNGAAPS
ncbi:MAG: hypothetical protein WDO56_14280 [Gammaproteobacteria bacterium]